MSGSRLQKPFFKFGLVKKFSLGIKKRQSGPSFNFELKNVKSQGIKSEQNKSFKTLEKIDSRLQVLTLILVFVKNKLVKISKKNPQLTRSSCATGTPGLLHLRGSIYLLKFCRAGQSTIHLKEQGPEMNFMFEVLHDQIDSYLMFCISTDVLIIFLMSNG